MEVLTVAPGPNRPYYLKSKGKENGTYIRSTGTSRPADHEKIKELEMEGAHISWDELTCIGYEATETEITKLCSDIMKYRRSIGETSEKYQKQFGEGLNDTQRKILELLSVDAKLSAAKLAKQIGISGRNVEVNIKKLKERGILIRCGSPKSGYWKIVDEKLLD